MNVISISNLSAHYKGICALKEITFKIKNKSFLAVLGPNGGGKSTLLKIILGLKTPTSGEVHIKEGTKMAYVPQFKSFDLEFPISVNDVILQGRIKQGIKFFHRYSETDQNLAKHFIEMLNLKNVMDRQIGELSGGQLQKILIARALVSDPDILLLDEPTANIDAEAKEDILNILKDLNKDKTIIMVTHSMTDIFSYCDCFAFIDRTLKHYGNSNNGNKNALNKLHSFPIGVNDKNYKKSLLKDIYTGGSIRL